MKIDKTTNGCLEDFIYDTYDNSYENRLLTENKWQRNYNSFNCYDNKKGKKNEAKGWRSDTYVRATKNKVVSGANLVTDVLMANGRLPFSLEEKRHLLPPGVDMYAIEKDKKGMIGVIGDQLAEGKADKEFSDAVLSASEYGDIIIKKIKKEVEDTRFEMVGPNAYEEKTTKKLIPAIEKVSVWDFFWDIEDDDLENNAYCIHRQLKSAYWLRDKKNKKYYSKRAINNILKQNKQKEGQNKLETVDDKTESLPPALRYLNYRENSVLYLEFWGRVPKDKVLLFEQQWKKRGEDVGYVGVEPVELSEEGEDIEIMACLACCKSGTKEIVKYSRISKKQRPFLRGVWEVNPDEPFGISVADNTEDMQNFLNWAVRAYEDNKKLSGNVMLMIKARYLEKIPKEPEPGSIYLAAEECDDVRQAIQPVVIPDVGESLLSAIHMVAIKFLDDDSLIPRIATGMPMGGDRTAMEVSQQVDKAGKYIGNVVKNMDHVIEGIIEYFYRENVKDTEIPFGKINYKVRALGFKTYQDRVIKIQKWNQFIAMVYSNPAFAEHADIRNNLEEYARIMGIEPDTALKDAKEIEAGRQQAMQMQQPMMALDMADKEADVRKKQAETMSEIEGVKIDQEKLKIDRAKAINELEKNK